VNYTTALRMFDARTAELAAQRGEVPVADGIAESHETGVLSDANAAKDSSVIEVDL
jgi:hypothetical protein